MLQCCCRRRRSRRQEVRCCRRCFFGGRLQCVDITLEVWRAAGCGLGLQIHVNRLTADGPALRFVGVGGWVCIDGGSKGIIIYRKATDVFVAFDRQSPKDPDGICVKPLTPDSINFLQLNDFCSDAKFSMYDGAAINNSEFGLRQYQTSWNGTNILRIYN